MGLASTPVKSSGAIPELHRGSRAVLLPAAKQHPGRLLQPLKRGEVVVWVKSRLLYHVVSSSCFVVSSY